MAEGPFILGSSTDSAIAGSKLRNALAAHAALEHARSLRKLAISILVALSLPVWLAAVRPRWMWLGGRRLVLSLWLVAALGLVWAAVSEWFCQQRCLRVVTPQREGRRTA